MGRRLALALVGFDRDLATALSVAARGYARALTAAGKSVPSSLLAIADDLDEFVATSGQLVKGPTCSREDGVVLTISEAAAIARISPRSVRRRLADGSLAHWRAGRQVRIKLDDLVTWMEQR